MKTVSSPKRGGGGGGAAAAETQSSVTAALAGDSTTTSHSPPPDVSFSPSFSQRITCPAEIPHELPLVGSSGSSSHSNNNSKAYDFDRSYRSKRNTTEFDRSNHSAYSRNSSARSLQSHNSTAAAQAAAAASAQEAPLSPGLFGSFRASIRSQPQIFKIDQDCDRIHVLDEDGDLFAIFEKELNYVKDKNNVLMYIKSANGDQVALLKEQKPPKIKPGVVEQDQSLNGGSSHSLVATTQVGPPPGTPTAPPKIGLRLYGHEPLYAGQVPKRKRMYNGPPPLYLWANLEKKRLRALLGSSATKYSLTIPFVPTEVKYTIKSSNKSNNKRSAQNTSKRNLLAAKFKLPFNNSSRSLTSAAASAATDNSGGNSTSSSNNNNNNNRGEQRQILSNGRVCATLKRCSPTTGGTSTHPSISDLDASTSQSSRSTNHRSSSSQQHVTVSPDTDPLLMVMFFAASNQLFPEDD